MANGFIKLHRSIIEWGWVNEPNTLRLWLQLLCTVMWERTEYKGITLEPGQRIASLSRLADETNMTIDKVRTAKQHLCTTGELTTRPTRYGDLITVENWAKYQERQEDNPTDNPTGNPNEIPRNFPRQSHENEEGEEYKNIINSARTPTHARTHDAIKEEKFIEIKGREVVPGLWVPDKPPRTDAEKRANYFKCREVFQAYRKSLEKGE